MHVEMLRKYCMAKKGVEETFPFDDTTIVFKVLGKMFALCGLNKIPPSVNLKCDPDKSLVLRGEYDDIQPGFHMNKKHWNTVQMEGNVEDKLIFDLIDHSYDLVVSKLTKKNKKILEDL